MNDSNDYDDIDNFFCNDRTSLSDDDSRFDYTVVLPVSLQREMCSINGSDVKIEEKVSENSNFEHVVGINDGIEQESSNKRTRDGFSCWSRDGDMDQASSSRSSSVSCGSISRVKAVKTSSFLIEDLEEDCETKRFLEEIEMEAARVSTLYSDNAEKKNSKRIYEVEFVSNLVGSENKRIIIKTTGDKKFYTFLPIALSTLVTQHRVSRKNAKYYKIDDVKIYREGLEVLKFMNCDSFNVAETYSGTFTNIEIFIVSNDEAKVFEVNWKKKLEERVRFHFGSPEIIELGSCSDSSDRNDIDDFRVNEYEKALTNARSLNECELKDTINYEDNDLSIKICLLGSDNKKIIAIVKASTTFDKIANYFKTEKRLSPSTKLKLTFDHDEIMFSDTVGSLGIEEDDIIEVSVL